MAEEDLDPSHIDGDDPVAPAGPDKCSAAPHETVIAPGERDGQAHETKYGPYEHVQDQFVSEELYTPIGADGLPDHSVDPVRSGTHPFTVETVCCIEDKSAYVEIFAEEAGGKRRQFSLASMRLRRDERERMGPLGRIARAARERLSGPTPQIRTRSKYADDGTEVERRTFEPERVTERFGVELVRADDDRSWIPVRPIRERCKYYARQVIANDERPDPEEFGHRIIMRLCTHPARRSIGGAAMGLSDEAIYNCDLRDPQHPSTTQWIDGVDDKKIRDEPHKVRLPMFGLEGDAVVEDAQGDPAVEVGALDAMASMLEKSPSGGDAAPPVRAGEEGDPISALYQGAEKKNVTVSRPRDVPDMFQELRCCVVEHGGSTYQGVLDLLPHPGSSYQDFVDVLDRWAKSDVLVQIDFEEGASGRRTEYAYLVHDPKREKSPYYAATPMSVPADVPFSGMREVTLELPKKLVDADWAQTGRWQVIIDGPCPRMPLRYRLLRPASEAPDSVSRNLELGDEVVFSAGDTTFRGRVRAGTHADEDARGLYVERTIDDEPDAAAEPEERGEP